MRLNTIKPSEGSTSNRKRVARGVGSGHGKTAGRGHKGQSSRSGGYHKVGFEGGQMPLQRRLPKVGFSSRKSYLTEEIRLYQIEGMSADVIDLEALKSAGIVSRRVTKAKVILRGELTRKVTLKGLSVSKGAAEAVKSAGGSVEV